jgi:CHAT domain-containing protein/Tfp pilus assembly protein PilF
MAENRMDEETQVEVYYQIRKYIGRISGADKVFPFMKSANSRLSPAEECMIKGMVYFSFGDDQKALEMYEKALAFYKETGNPLGHWWLYLNMGDIYFFKGYNSTALSMYRTAVSIYEQGQFSPIDSIVKKVKEYRKAEKFEEALQELNKAMEKFPQKEYRGKLQTELSYLHGFWAVNLMKKFDYNNAIKHYEIAYAIEKLYRPHNTAIILSNIGSLYNTLGQNQKALEYLEKALPIRKAVGDRPGEATTLAKIGRVYSDLGQKQKALYFYQDALSIQEEVGNRSGEATILSNIGAVYSALGQNQKALEFQHKALHIWKEVGDPSGEAPALNNIGMAYSALGQKQKALEYHEKALTIIKIMGDRIGEAYTLSNIGAVYNTLGQNQKALEYHEKSLTIKKAIGDRNGEATSLNNIGAVYNDLGQNQKALEYHEKSLTIKKAIGDRNGEATSLNNIGVIYDDLGQKQKALEYYEKALPIRRAVGDRAGEAYTLSNIGAVYNALGQNQKALEYFEKALHIWKALGNLTGESITFNNIGHTYYALGQNQKTLEYYNEALPIYQAVGDRAGEAVTLSSLMPCWESLKNPLFSIFYGKQSVNAYQNLRTNISKLDRMIKKSYLEIKENTYRFLAGLLIDEERIPEAQHVLDMLKEKEYSQFTRRDLNSTTSTYSQMDFTEFEEQWLEKYKNVTKDYSSISGDYYLLKRKKIKSDAEKKRMKELEASLEQYQKDYNRYLAKLKKAFDKYNKTVKKGTIKTPNSQKLLRERQATLKNLDEKEGGKNVFLHFSVQDERIAVIFTTPDSQFTRLIKVNKKKLNRLILEYREAIERRKSAPQKVVNNSSINKTIYGKLYDHIFKSVDIELKKYGATNLMIYLDGLLRYIALSVLWDGETYLVQRYRMALFTNASFEQIKLEPGKNNRILGLGASRGGDGFDPLPNVKEEIQNIVNDKEKGFKGIIPGKAFLDNDFTKETFVSQLKTATYPLVHISSHFQFNKGDETKSHLLMGDGSLMNLKEIREQKGLFNRVELLMLSACETGRGDADGREIDGFGELAQQSGAQSVVASLWKVTDESTKYLMVNFYRILKQGKVTSKIEALRQAQLELAGLDDLLDKNNTMVKRKKSKYSHPYYWGPFIMIGNWR